MSNFKKVLAFLCSATLIVGSSVTAFAADPATTPATTTGGDGNIVAYSCETVTVPTAVKVSFNPQSWTFVVRDHGDEDPDTSTSQIVSLNYGISSMATLDKKITVDFSIEGTEGTGSKEIVYVDSAAKAQAKTESNADGAAPGEYKMYIAVAPSKAAIAQGYDNSAEAAGAQVDLEIETDDSGIKSSTVTSALLADVVMDAATGTGVQAFADNKASIAYKLGKATYELEPDTNPTFATTQTAFKDMVMPNTLGDIVGFTFIGAMNPNADWTKAKLTALKITPTYEVADVDGTEEVLETPATNGYQVIGGTAAAATATSLTTTFDSTNSRYKITMPEGVTLSATSDITDFQVGGKAVTVTKSLNSGKNIIQIAKADLKTAMGADWPASSTDSLVITFKVGTTSYTTTVNRN